MIENQTVSCTDDQPRQTPKARREFPGLCEYGVRPPPGPPPTPVRADQVATAMEYLRQFRPITKGSYSSYHLKHLCENWGNKAGLSFYVSNGALITAALLLSCSRIAGRHRMRKLEFQGATTNGWWGDDEQRDDRDR